MTHHKALHDLIKQAAEASGQLFKMKGRIVPIFDVLTAAGERVILPAPPGDKDSSLAIARAYFELRNVVSLVFINEAWLLDAVTAADREAAAREGLAAHPRRIEVVMYVAEDETGHVQGHRPIIRPRHGKARLGPLKINADGGTYEGRFIGLLPARGTRQ
jgi:hypothetical protein